MRKSRVWHSLWIICPLILVLPPLGIFMLWKSPRKLPAKIVLTTIFVLLFCGGALALVKSNYSPWARPPIPDSGFAVDMDERNRYVIPDVLPLESEVFNAVVSEFRNMPARASIDMTDVNPGEMPQPRMQVYRKVAEQFGLEVEDVMAIHLKVSSRLEPKR